MRWRRKRGRNIPDHVDPGQASVPHQLVHGPLVHSPSLALAQGPHPLPGPPWPKGPYPPPALHPGGPPPGPPRPPSPSWPSHAPPPLGPQPYGAPVVTLAQELATLLRGLGSGWAEVREAQSAVAVGQAVRLAPEVQEAKSE